MSKENKPEEKAGEAKSKAADKTGGVSVAVLPVQGPHATKHFYRPFQLQAHVTKIAAGGKAYAFDGTQYNPEKVRAEHWLKAITTEDLSAKSEELLQSGWSEADA